MEFLHVPAEEAAVRRYLEDLWLPFQHDLTDATDDFELADDVDLDGGELDFWMDQLESEHYRIVVAYDPAEGESDPAFVDADGEFRGFVATNLDQPPESFVRPDRITINELWVRERYRGEGVADELVADAVERAETEGCPELTLEVNADNERAMAFYEKLGFEPMVHQMVVDADEVASRLE